MLTNWSNALWSVLMPLLLVTGVWLTVKSRFFALRKMGYAVGLTFSPGSEKNAGKSPFACLCTALAATVGTGNIAGVAFALSAGGPGALVWMWISAAVGCGVKYAECALAVRYRVKDRDGVFLGGPMVTLVRGLSFKKIGTALGSIYAALAVCHTMTAGNLVQSSAIATSLRQMAGVPVCVTGVLVGGLTLLVLMGGAGGVTRFSAALVPVMVVLYVCGGCAVLITHACRLPAAGAELLRCAFSLRSMGAGAFGQMVRIGVTRGCFSNESGTGSAAFSAAMTCSDPVRQGLISTTANLWDTGLVCSITGLAILVSGVAYDGSDGIATTMAAFRTGLGQAGGWIVGLCLILFAFTTLPGLAFQGERALRFLRDGRLWVWLYRLGFCAVAALGCGMSPAPALAAADLFNALLMGVNLISLWLIPAPIDETQNR